MKNVQFRFLSNSIITGTGLAILFKNGHKPFQKNTNDVKAFLWLLIALYTADIFRTIRGRQNPRFKIYTVVHHLVLIANAIESLISGYWGMEGIRHGAIDGNLYEIGRNGASVFPKLSILFKILSLYGFGQRVTLDRLYPTMSIESPRPMPISFKVTHYLNRCLISLIAIEKMTKWYRSFLKLHPGFFRRLLSRPSR